MPSFLIRPTVDQDRSFIRELISHCWKAEDMVLHGEIYCPAELPGFMAEHDHETLGLITYQIMNNSCEIITLDSIKEHQGIGTQLIETVKTRAVKTGCSRFMVITTNDNLPALGFYQNCGFKIKEIAINAVQYPRVLKPFILLTGYKGTPIRDEIALEMSLSA